MHTLYVTNITFIVLLAHQEYLYSNHHWNKSLITQLVLYITCECVNKDNEAELYVVEKGKMPNSLLKIRRVNCNFVGLLHHPLWLRLLSVLFLALFFTFFNFFFWLRISDEGSIPEMRIWSILLIKSDLKWCIHLSRSLYLYCKDLLHSCVQKLLVWDFEWKRVGIYICKYFILIEC